MMSAIYTVLEGFDADAPHDVDKALFFALASIEIKFDQTLDHVRHLGLRNRRAEHLAERSIVALRAADRNLEPL